MDSWRSLQVVFPRFFQGSPEKGSRGVPTAFQRSAIAAQGVPKASPGHRKDSPRPPQGVSKHGQLILGRAITKNISRTAITNHISSTTILLLATFGIVPIWCFCRVVSPCPFFQNDLFQRSPQVFQLMFLSCRFIFFVHCTRAL